jgi:hypothetical protein
MATRHQELGNALWHLGDLAGARTHLELALAIDEAVLGAGHPMVVNDRRQLDRVLQKLSDK